MSTQKKGIRKAILNSLKNPGEWFFWVGAFITFIYQILLIIEFIQPLSKNIPQVKLTASITIFLLSYTSAYSGVLEIKKWIGKRITIKHPGELILIFVCIIDFIILIINTFKSEMKLPGELLNSACGLLSIWVLANFSKMLRKKIIKQEVEKITKNLEEKINNNSKESPEKSKTKRSKKK